MQTPFLTATTAAVLLTLPDSLRRFLDEWLSSTIDQHSLFDKLINQIDQLLSEGRWNNEILLIDDPDEIRRAYKELITGERARGIIGFRYRNSQLKNFKESMSPFDSNYYFLLMEITPTCLAEALYKFKESLKTFSQKGGVPLPKASDKYPSKTDNSPPVDIVDINALCNNKPEAVLDILKTAKIINVQNEIVVKAVEFYLAWVCLEQVTVPTPYVKTSTNYTELHKVLRATFGKKVGVLRHLTKQFPTLRDLPNTHDKKQAMIKKLKTAQATLMKIKPS